jgi:hypothetical protein
MRGETVGPLLRVRVGDPTPEITDKGGRDRYKAGINDHPFGIRLGYIRAGRRHAGA